MKKQYVYLRTNTYDPRQLGDYHKSLAYYVDFTNGIAIVKNEAKHLPYQWTDIATGCGFGRGFRTLKEANEFRHKEVLFQEWLEKLIHNRKFVSLYFELRRQKQVWMNKWRVVDEL